MKDDIEEDDLVEDEVATDWLQKACKILSREDMSETSRKKVLEREILLNRSVSDNEECEDEVEGDEPYLTEDDKFLIELLACNDIVGMEYLLNYIFFIYVGETPGYHTISFMHLYLFI